MHGKRFNNLSRSDNELSAYKDLIVWRALQSLRAHLQNISRFLGLCM